jgi:anti-sigma regulatory factor (Ser/Thr protein kinase)
VSNSRFRHTIFVYESDAEYVRAAVEFLRSGVEAGEGALVAAARDRQALIRSGLEPVPEEIGFLDLRAAGDRPAKVLALQYAALGERLRRFPAVRLLIGVEAGPPGDGWPAWIGYEAALERLLAALPVWALCGYDARQAPAPLLDAVLRGHPERLDRADPGTAHVDPVELLRDLTPPPRPLPELRTVARDTDAETLREQLGVGLAEVEVDGSQALQALVATNEAILNACRHGEPPVEVRVGRVEDRLVCEVVDRGRGFDDPLAGFDPPGDPGDRAPGLWVVRQAVRRLETFRAADGFTVRLWF